MILEFKKSRLILLIGLAIGLIVTGLLFLFTQQLFVLLLFVFLYPWMLYRYSKKAALRSIQDLEKILHRELDAKRYIDKYNQLIDKPKSRDSRWNLKKYHNIMLAALVLNDQPLFNQYLKASNEKFESVYRILPVFNYLKNTLLVMEMAVFENKHSTKVMEESFEKLDKQIQATILKNPYSFHNWVLNLTKYNESEIESLPNVLKKLTMNAYENNSKKFKTELHISK